VVLTRVRWQREHRGGLAAQARAVEALRLRARAQAMEAVALQRLRASPWAWKVLIALTAPVVIRVAKFAVVSPRAARRP